MENKDLELEAMNEIHKALTTLKEEPAAINRVLIWATNRFNAKLILDSPRETLALSANENTNNEFSRYARVDKEGNLLITIRDLKAKSAADAVKRLTYVCIYLHLKILSDKPVSRKHFINPLLESWRIYSGNARAFIGADRGIIKSGDGLELDVHATEEAEAFLRDIQNTELVGTWNPTAKKTIKKQKNSVTFSKDEHNE